MPSSDRMEIYRAIANLLIRCKTEKELKQFIAHSMDRIDPFLYAAVIKLGDESPLDERVKFEHLRSSLFPLICINSVRLFLTMPHEVRSVVVNDWLACLANKIGEEVWEREYNNAAPGMKAEFDRARVLVTQAILDFAMLFPNPIGLLDWLNRTKYFLLKPNEVRATRQWQMPADWEYLDLYTILGNFYHQNDSRDPDELPEIAIGWFDKALSLVTKEDNPQIWAMIMHDSAPPYIHRRKGVISENLATAIDRCHQALEIQQKQLFPREWSSTQITLGGIYTRLESGNIADNLKKSIEYYKNALEIRTREAYPEMWGMIQHNLGMSYGNLYKCQGISGIEEAIRHLTLALEVRTRQKYPEQWAVTHHQLARMYEVRYRESKKKDFAEMAIAEFELSKEIHDRTTHPYLWARTLLGIGICLYSRRDLDKATSQDKAISAIELSLEVLTATAYQDDWALANDYLGRHYLDRLRGEKITNIERAIECLQLALTFYTRNLLPIPWALLHRNLGVAYSERILGDLSDNIEQGIWHYNESLQVFTEESMPKDWASVMGELGTIYHHRLKGDPTENREKALTFFKLALQKFTDPDDAENGAWIQGNLGPLYFNRTIGDRSQNIELAIESYNKALTCLTKPHQLIDRARILTNLFHSLSVREKGVKAENIELAIQVCQEALQIRTQKDTPYGWSSTQNNLGLGYVQRINGDRADNLKLAILAFRNSLLIRKPSTLPRECLTTRKHLAELYCSMGDYMEALTTLEEGYEAFEYLRGQFKKEASKISWSTTNWSYYSLLVQCCIQQGYIEKAFEYAAASKGRTLAEKIGTSLPDVHQMSLTDAQLASDWQEIESLSQQSEQLRAKLQQDATPINEITATLNGMDEKIRKKVDEFRDKYPMFVSPQTVPVITGAQAKQLADRLGTPIIEYYHHNDAWVAFIISSSAIQHVELPATAHETLSLFTYLVLDYEAGKLLFDPLKEKALLRKLYQDFALPLLPLLPPGGELMIAPHQFLHNIPLGLAEDETGVFFYEKFELIFTASSSTTLALLNLQSQKNNSPNERILIVAHVGSPPDTLTWAIPEAESVSALFSQSDCLYNDKATPAAVITNNRDHIYDVLHFSCHAGVLPSRPELSGLELNGLLSIERIIFELRLRGRPLVVLSACRTAWSEAQVADELVSLHQALLQAGAGTIIGSLWSVNDQSTMLLFNDFYKKLKLSGFSPAKALRSAMSQVRKTYPSHSIFYWGAFQIYGLPF